jgi:GIY-YIG catalytic domain
MPTEIIVSGYARMWPREVFGLFPAQKNAASKRKKAMATGLDFLQKAGVYILYKDDEPYYIGQATKLQTRLRGHAVKAESRYFHFWNFFSAFAVSNPSHRDELEGILIAAMPTANSAKPKLQRERMPKEVRDLLKRINLFVPGSVGR